MNTHLMQYLGAGGTGERLLGVPLYRFGPVNLFESVQGDFLLAEKPRAIREEVLEAAKQCSSRLGREDLRVGVFILTSNQLLALPEPSFGMSWAVVEDLS